jgi:hypothetical protein
VVEATRLEEGGEAYRRWGFRGWGRIEEGRIEECIEEGGKEEGGCLQMQAAL